jgi:uncharacterized surface anchored protein
MEDLVGPGPISIFNCGSVNVTKTGSDGGSQDGAVFTLYKDFGLVTQTTIGTCTVTSGQCGSVPSFDNLVAGSYTLDETTVPSGYTADATLPETFSVAAGDSITKAYVNTAQPATISITKTDDLGNALPGATFTAYTGPDITGTPAGSCSTLALGTCTISGLAAGQYTVDETTVPTGYAKDSSLPVTITLSNGQTYPLTLSDPRTFKTIVIVCQESNGHLYPSDITIDGTKVGNSVASTDLSGIGSGALTQADLCAIAKGSKGGQLSAPDASDPHAASVDIPNHQ